MVDCPQILGQPKVSPELGPSQDADCPPSLQTKTFDIFNNHLELKVAIREEKQYLQQLDTSETNLLSKFEQVLSNSPSDKFRTPKLEMFVNLLCQCNKCMKERKIDKAEVTSV